MTFIGEELGVRSEAGGQWGKPSPISIQGHMRTWVGLGAESSGQGAQLCLVTALGNLTCLLLTDALFLSKPFPSSNLAQLPPLGDDFAQCHDIRP